MKNVILYIWQLPQNLLGLAIIKLCKGKLHFLKSEGDPHLSWRYYIIDSSLIKCSVALGKYIIAPVKNKDKETTMRHEWGHTKQSLMFGPLYLLVIGLPSVIRNRISVRKKKPSSWYYGYAPDMGTAYPEKWADKLGGVKR